MTHLPYAPWCKVCVAARAVADPHRRRDPIPEDERQVETAKVYFDHVHFRPRRGAQTQKVLVAVDRKSGMKFVVMPTKHVDSESIVTELIQQGLQRLGL